MAGGPEASVFHRCFWSNWQVCIFCGKGDLGLCHGGTGHKGMAPDEGYRVGFGREGI